MGKPIGFIGLGIMGGPMARNLVRGGADVMVNDLSRAAMDALCAEGARPADREELARSCGVVFMILPNGAIARDVILGENGLCRFMQPGSLVIDCSSVAPTDSRFCAEKLAEKGIAFMDAPVSGGQEGAERGSLAIMAGGTEADFERAEPYFNMMGSKATLVGAVGSGSVTKLANQAIVNLNIAAVSEALVLAKKAGANPQKVFEAIHTGLAGSQVLEDKAPRMIRGEFTPGGAIAVNHKDIRNVLAAAHEYDAPMPMCALLFEILQSLKVSGSFQEDHSAIVRYYERLAGLDSLN